MTAPDDRIIPSWEDAADRWMNAYTAMKAERDALAARCTLTDEETESVRGYLTFLDRAEGATTMTAVHLQAVLRRLLAEQLA